MNRREMLAGTLGATFALALSSSPILASRSRKVLILIELQGANDGLNMVVPYANDRYYSLRPNIGIERSKVLDLDDQQGMHPSLSGVRNLFDKGYVKVFQNVGYPNQIQSHFRSIEAWERGGDGNRNGRSGWFVEASDSSSLNQVYDVPGIYLGGTSDIFHGGIGYLGSASFAQQRQTASLKDEATQTVRQGLLGRVSKKRISDQQKSLLITEKLKNAKQIAFGGSDLGRQLSQVCKLLSADVRAPVFKVSIGSFDTHADQLNTHRKLLANLDKAISQTVEELEVLGIWDDVAIMTYSEFGRRVKENGARGTDHGTAAPHFLISKALGSGIEGGLPDLERLKNGDLQFKVDYRAMYNYVLQKNFGLKQNPFDQYGLPST